MTINLVIKKLQELEKGWPKGYMLYADGNSLKLYKGHPCDADRDREPQLQPVETFRIPSDGGGLP